jgi:hypothetical protein
MVREWLRSQRVKPTMVHCPGAACHICELKRPVSRYLAQEDYYGRSGAQLQLYCDVAGEALGLAIIRPTERCRNHGPLTAKALKIALVLVRLDHVASVIANANHGIMRAAVKLRAAGLHEGPPLPRH